VPANKSEYSESGEQTYIASDGTHRRAMTRAARTRPVPSYTMSSVKKTRFERDFPYILRQNRLDKKSSPVRYFQSATGNPEPMRPTCR
jgi:hypothetical protein